MPYAIADSHRAPGPAQAAAHRTLRRVSQGVCLLLAAGSLIGVAPAAGVTQPAASPGEQLTSLTLASVGPGGSQAGVPSLQADVAADGRYVAFEQHGLVSRIYVRDLTGRTTTLLSDPAAGGATAPSISADGRLISYEQAGDVFAADRQASGSGAFGSPGNLTVRRVTGTPADPAYSHPVPCPARVASPGVRVAPCGPRLSADGSTLVYPVQLSPVSPDLSVTATLGEDTSALTGDVLDFTPDDPETYGFPFGTAMVSYRNTGRTAVTFPTGGGITVTEPPGQGFPPGEPFQLGDSSCAGRLGPGQSCTVSVTFNQDECDVPDQATLLSAELTSHAATPAGQSVLELTGFCALQDSETPRLRQGPAAGPGDSCPALPRGLALVRAPATVPDNQGTPLSDAGGAEIGRPYVLWMPLNAPANEDASTFSVLFASANGIDCGIRLVNPARLKLADPPPKSAPRACRQGETLESAPSGSRRTPAVRPTGAPPPSSCTAYLLVNPDAVAPDNAFLGTEYQDFSFGPAVVASAYLTVRGVRHAVVARRDATGAGNFAASRAAIVSVTGGGDLPGAGEPSVSADGQYVAFAAPVPIGQPGQQAAAGATEVWRHDTGGTGGTGGRPGATTLASCLPRSRPGGCAQAPNADSPSISGSGQQVAFATTAAIVPHNGFTGETGSSRTGGKAADQIFVRSEATGQTTLISASPAATADAGQPAAAGNGASYAPAITEDGTTVGYVSLATNLTGVPVAEGAANLYLRPVSVGPAASEVVSADGASLPGGTAVGVPSVDAHGRQVAFPATAALTAGAPAFTESAYAFERFPQLTVAPAAAAFGSVLIDSRPRTERLTITNTGPGPGTVTATPVTGPFGTGASGCDGLVLYPGSQCTITVTFRAADTGQAAGVLTVTTEDDSDPPVSVAATVTATVPVPRLTLSPGVASAGDVTEVRGSDFPPSQAIRLSWSPGLGTATAATSAGGGFGAPMVIFPADILGSRLLIAGTTASRRLATAPFLVQPGSAEPPFTSASLADLPGG